MSQFPPRALIRMAAELIRTEPHQSRPTAINPPTTDGLRFLSLRDVLDGLTISRSLFYELIKDPIQPFPAPAHIGRRSVWITNKDEAYMISATNTSRDPSQLVPAISTSMKG